MNFTPVATINKNALMITEAEILEDLDPNTGHFPMEARMAAVKEQAAITP